MDCIELFAVVFAGSAIVLFLAHLSGWKAAGFTGHANFKPWLSLFYEGIMPGPANVIFLVLAIIVLFNEIDVGPAKKARVLQRTSLFLLALCITFTMSRALYLAVVLFSFLVLASVALLLGTSQLGAALVKSLPACVCLAAICLSLGMGKAVIATALIARTTSQQLSTAGHLAFAKHALTLFRLHPVLGVGPGNFAAAINTMDTTKIFQAQAFSFPVELASEFGCVGLVFALAALVSQTALLVRAVAARKSANARFCLGLYILCAGLLAILVHQCFFSSLLTTGLVSSLVFALLALFVNNAETVLLGAAI